jgi:alpha-beta hydrolase superfamily lysophospholipase
MRSRTRVRIARSAIALALAFTLAACTPTTARRFSEGLAQELTEAPFYRLPDPVVAAAPGTIVRTEPIPNAPDGAKAWRVLYHSTDVLGHDILVSGVVVTPTSPAPSGGRPIMSWGHPTTGAVQRCAPSVGVDPFDTIEGLSDFLKRGYVVAATDYSGMGAAGPDSYLIGTTEGNNVLDAARAARNIPGAHADSDLVLWGHSQGGQAVLFAAQSAKTYAPELRLKAAAVAAPATNLGELLNADIGDVSGVTIASYALVAYSSVYGPSIPKARLGDILTPAGAQAAPVMAKLCLFGQNKELHTDARPLVGGFLSADPTKTEPWAGLLEKNTPGATRIDVPLFVAQGETDTLVRPASTDAFVATERSNGTDVSYLKISKTGHGLVALRALPRLFTWLSTAEG